MAEDNCSLASDPESRFKLIFLTPKSSTQDILQYLLKKFPRELGSISPQKHSAFITSGMDQYTPGPEANPTIGAPGVEERVDENKVEMVVNGGVEVLRRAVNELKLVHPYEEVGYEVYRLECTS
ncbi:hypothetical protein SERLA73DRAFT_121037 [Serpula lacrymans var. lacrymans S7.3]|uniref:ATP phosphoribosyltransferase n=2 Tax=Serpula lacrymans var. lacrymans TaxID=341189 RepID=F8PRF1_SERL3|nr:uncharacterized protein SERLADRAFT_367743 [Serpula lacrymans var. lacrymans S7.9]EGO00574.1 hypothetical protein SERLA73DRAFT_121037 [Serpula lacrymans var. lacrymans S7.3]EGO26129.1 hypothetical protein SERLADRAFT_367743 [Serpula lacrymans var. lacrymans S7.9]